MKKDQILRMLNKTKQKKMKMKMKLSFLTKGLALISFLMFGYASANVLETQTSEKKYHFDYCPFANLTFYQSVLTDGAVFVPVRQMIENNSELRDLLYGINPILYVTTNGIEQNSSEIPIVVHCKGNAINSLYENNEFYKNVKAIIIVIDDLNYSNLDFSLLESFQNLEYLFISFTFDICNTNNDNCVLSLLQNIVTSHPSNVTMLYELSIPN